MLFSSYLFERFIVHGIAKFRSHFQKFTDVYIICVGEQEIVLHILNKPCDVQKGFNMSLNLCLHLWKFWLMSLTRSCVRMIILATDINAKLFVGVHAFFLN